jgi:hypothetical protein
MTTRKILMSLSLLGLGLSLSLLFAHSTHAASGSSRALSAAQMAATRGAGSCCTGVQCNGTNGCNSNGTLLYTWYPSYYCQSCGYGDCGNLYSQNCKRIDYYTGYCPNAEYWYNQSTWRINFCGLYP